MTGSNKIIKSNEEMKITLYIIYFENREFNINELDFVYGSLLLLVL